MATDKEIRKFIRDNAPEIHGSERFMAELVRQIELLPVPASLAGKSDEEIEANLRFVRQLAQTLKRRNRVNAIGATVVSILALAVIAVFFCLMPSLRDTVAEYYLYFGVGFAAVILCAALFSLRYSL